MCGIAGLIHRDGTANIGKEMTAMLLSLRHRGPDSTGYALYGKPGRNDYVMRFKVAEQEDTKKGFDIHDEISAAGPWWRSDEEPRRHRAGARGCDGICLSLPHPI